MRVGDVLRRIDILEVVGGRLELIPDGGHLIGRLVERALADRRLRESGAELPRRLRQVRGGLAQLLLVLLLRRNRRRRRSPGYEGDERDEKRLATASMVDVHALADRGTPVEPVCEPHRTRTQPWLAA